MLEQVRAIQMAHHAQEAVPDFPRIEKVARLINQQPPGKLLDVGYSEGSFADTLSRQGWRCVGLDLSPVSNPSIFLIRCDLNEGFPVESEAFDAVTAGEVIEHMLDEGAFLQECCRVLKPGGILALTTPNLTFWVNRLLILMGKTPIFVTAPYHYHFHTRKTITQLIEERGFRVEKVISSHLLFSRRRHSSGLIFEWLGDIFPTLGAHLIVLARKC